MHQTLAVCIAGVSGDEGLPRNHFSHSKRAWPSLRARAPQRRNAKSSDICPRATKLLKSDHGINLPVRDHTGRRYPANPTPGPLPCPNRRRIIHADRPVWLDNPPSSRSFRRLWTKNGNSESGPHGGHSVGRLSFRAGTISAVASCSSSHALPSETRSMRAAASKTDDLPVWRR